MDKWNPRVWLRNGLRRFARWLNKPTTAEEVRLKESAEAFGQWLAEQSVRHGSSIARSSAGLEALQQGLEAEFNARSN